MSIEIRKLVYVCTYLAQCGSSTSGRTLKWYRSLSSDFIIVEYCFSPRKWNEIPSHSLRLKALRRWRTRLTSKTCSPSSSCYAVAVTANFSPCSFPWVLFISAFRGSVIYAILYLLSCPVRSALNPLLSCAFSVFPHTPRVTNLYPRASLVYVA